MNRSIAQDERMKARLANRCEVDETTGCWNFTGTVTGNGYGHISFYGQVEYTHRVAAVLYRDFDLQGGSIVMHICDNQRCFNPDHLAFGTQQQNMSDAARKGRMGGKKLAPSDVAQIKWLLHSGATQSQLATRFGVSTTTIGQIYRGQTWRSIEARQPAEEPSSTSQFDVDPKEAGDDD